MNTTTSDTETLQPSGNGWMRTVALLRDQLGSDFAGPLPEAPGDCRAEAVAIGKQRDRDDCDADGNRPDRRLVAEEDRADTCGNLQSGRVGLLPRA